MDTYKIPTNVKQIGNVDNELRVYIEDYVYSYLLQYAKANDNDESIAILIGRCMIIDGKKVLFISGAIQGIYSETKKGILTFSDETYEYVEEQRLKHFKGLEIVGWMLSQPGYGTYLSTGHVNYHINNFKKPYQIMFVLDTVEKMNTFFQYDKEKEEMLEMEGFFIFYEKNEEMQQYITENRIETNIEDEVSKLIKIRKPEVSENIKEEKENNIEEVHESNKIKEEVNKINVVNIDKREKSPKIKKLDITKRTSFNFNQQILAGGLALVVMATFGISAVANDNKITRLENDVNVLTEAYNLLVTHVNNSDNVSQVFASSDNNVVETKSIDEMPKEDEIKTDVELETENIDLSELQSNVIVEVIEDEKTDVEENNIETFATDISNYYVVKQGDSLISISRSIYGTDNMQQKIMDVNNIEDPNKIYFGMKLLLP